MKNRFGEGTEILWHDRKRWCGLPWTFTQYDIVKKEGSYLKLFRTTGLLSTSVDEVNFFRIFDLSLDQSLFDKMFGVGTITLYVNDESSDKVVLRKVKNPYKVRAMIAELVEKERSSKGFRLTEFHS